MSVSFVEIRQFLQRPHRRSLILPEEIIHVLLEVMTYQQLLVLETGDKPFGAKIVTKQIVKLEPFFYLGQLCQCD